MSGGAGDGATAAGRGEEFPADGLVLLIGPAGVGKTTWAMAHFPSHAIISSDALRELLSGDADDQGATRGAFRLLHTIVRARLKRGLLTVVDATNVTTGARRSLLTLAERADRPTVAVAFDLPLERILEQNAARSDRRVPAAVVRRHHHQLKIALPRLAGEGYRTVRRVTEDDIDTT